VSTWPEQPFLAGSWAVVRQPGEVVALDCEGGEPICLRGAISGPDFEGSLATLRGLARLNPELEGLYAALASEERQPLTYRTLLGRGGWEILFLELTGRCNERCRHCYAESSPEQKEELSWAEIESAVRLARRLDVRRLQLTGGDPLISRHCAPAARLAKSLGVPEVEVYTNGLALTETLADELCGLGVSFAMSFYSHRPEVHDAVTGTPGSQRRTLAAISRVLARGRPLRVSLISTADNHADLAETIALLESVGVSRSQLGLDEERGVGRGTFGDRGDDLPRGLLDLDGETAADSGVSAHGGLGSGGKLCISYRGELHPCIFSRQQRLGSIREGTLEAWLDAPLTLGRARSALPLASAQSRLTCGDCRATEALLDRLAPLGPA